MTSTATLHKRSTGPSGNILSEYVYVNNSIGQRLQSLETTRQADGSLTQTEITYTYDALGRLTQEKSQDLSGSGPQFTYTTNYTYDVAGNRISSVTTSATGTVTTVRTIQRRRRVLSETSSDGTLTTYSYDANGSLLQEQVNGQTVEQYTYNLQNEMHRPRRS